MPTVNVYVPDQLKSEMDAMADQPNWSGLFQDVARAEIARAKAIAGDRDAIVARVKSKGSNMEQAGFSDGALFAKTNAGIDDFEAAEKYLVDCEDIRNGWRQVVEYLGVDDGYFFEGDSFDRLPRRYLKGFANGMMEVYQTVRDDLEAA